MSRSEDRLIAWTWRTFVDQLLANETTDPEVILRMPMTKVTLKAYHRWFISNDHYGLALNVLFIFVSKSAKRGMDTIAAVANEKIGADIDRFAITGASKVTYFYSFSFFPVMQ